ncbi:MAG TPA: GNAT family N-acetyltransferase [Thermoanaerobaculia bacterium]|nr:GNAT family N-acetyltransferase [Thermoanaerobaculia bacterium]
MSSFRIRKATEEDVGMVLYFIRALAEYERLAERVTATEETLRATLFGQPRFAEVLIGEEDGRAVGFALFFHNYSTFLGRPGIYLEDLFVVPEARGRGYGKALLARLASIARERQCHRMEWAVLDWNTPSIDFYRAMGAVEMSDWKTFRLTGEALERLALESPSPG